jgi:hypothetical protein
LHAGEAAKHVGSDALICSEENNSENRENNNIQNQNIHGKKRNKGKKRVKKQYDRSASNFTS